MNPQKIARPMACVMGVLLLLACLTGGVVGAGVLVLLVAAYGIRTYTWPHLREALRAQAERTANCVHEWGEQFEVGRPMGFFRMRFWAAICTKCGKTEHRNEDGTVYIPRSERRDDT